MIELIIDDGGTQESYGEFDTRDIVALIHYVSGNGIHSSCGRFRYSYRGHELQFSANAPGKLVMLLNVGRTT
jgi:hypothetical protein